MRVPLCCENPEVFPGRFSAVRRNVLNIARFQLTVVGIALIAACGSSGGGSANTTASDFGGPVPNTFTGTVLYQGAPLAGVTVTALNNNSNPSTVFGVTSTDVNGNYTFTGLPTGWDATPNYSFLATKAGYSFLPVLAANPSGNRADYLYSPLPQCWYVNAGAAVTRAGFNSMFTNQNGGAPILFTVFNFNSTKNNSVTGANFNAYTPANPPLSLAATGQATSYASGDDASLKRGVAWPAVRYVDNLNGTVTDNLTGLIWLKNAGCFTPAPWASALADANQLANGACGLTDGSTPGQWRLPNLVELESMVDVSASNPALAVGSPFANVSNGIYWSSTAYYGGQEGTTNAWAIRLGDGRYMNDTTSNVMASSNNAVWAVKGAGCGAVKLQATGANSFFVSGDDGAVESGTPLPYPRMFDNGNGTVTDIATGLIWLKQADCINQSWAGAVNAVNTLASGQCGLSDGSSAGSWRMPNRKEMQSLADRGQNNMALYFNENFLSGNAAINSQPAIFSNFIGTHYYWTSTTNAADTSEAWTVYSCDYGVYDIPKSNTGYSLAVR